MTGTTAIEGKFKILYSWLWYAVFYYLSRFQVLAAVNIKITVFRVWQFVIWYKGTSVLKEPAASIFRVEEV
jgi:hypothetical protein